MTLVGLLPKCSALSVGPVKADSEFVVRIAFDDYVVAGKVHSLLSDLMLGQVASPTDTKAEPVACVACDDRPVHPNVPCAVCKCSPTDTRIAGIEEAKAVLQSIYDEGRQNHNTRCRSWWPALANLITKEPGQ